MGAYWLKPATLPRCCFKANAGEKAAEKLNATTVAAVYEAVNELESRRNPLLASPQGGVAAHKENIAKHPYDREAGVVFR